LVSAEDKELESCAKQLEAMQVCLQDHLLICGQDCVFKSTIIENATEATCADETTQYCSVADCCPQCFGETQAALTCQYTYTDETEICDTKCACEDTPGFMDADDYDCEWYAADAEERCSKFGDKSENSAGETGNVACCACKVQVSSAPVMKTLMAAVGVLAAFMIM